MARSGGGDSDLITNKKLPRYFFTTALLPRAMIDCQQEAKNGFWVGRYGGKFRIYHHNRPRTLRVRRSFDLGFLVDAIFLWRYKMKQGCSSR